MKIKINLRDVLPKSLWDLPQQYILTKEERDKRLALCLACEDLTGAWQCRHCLCFMHIKTWLKNEHCEKPKPEERKWNAQ